MTNVAQLPTGMNVPTEAQDTATCLLQALWEQNKAPSLLEIIDTLSVFFAESELSNEEQNAVLIGCLALQYQSLYAGRQVSHLTE